MTDMTLPIRLKHRSRYGEAGTVNSTLDYGVRATLVESGRAEWITPPAVETVKPSRKDKSDKGN